jgi:hypothetical protein
MPLSDANVKIGNIRLPTIKDTFNSEKQSFNFPTEEDIFNPGIQDILNTNNEGNIFLFLTFSRTSCFSSRIFLS